MGIQIYAHGAPAEPIFYEDGKDWRIVDPRPHGAECIPLLAFGNFSAVLNIFRNRNNGSV